MVPVLAHLHPCLHATLVLYHLHQTGLLSLLHAEDWISLEIGWMDLDVAAQRCCVMLLGNAALVRSCFGVGILDPHALP